MASLRPTVRTAGHEPHEEVAGGLPVERLSVDDAGRWMPHPDAYRYAVERCSVPLERCAMVAVHPWDLHGVAAVGMTTAYVDRRGTTWPAVFTPPHVPTFLVDGRVLVPGAQSPGTLLATLQRAWARRSSDRFGSAQCV